ncbi:MAG: recombination protein RecR [Deltaproteobacteria bacterium]|nr:recombination protein RecR [Deltaproteobacteria bacterium]
MHNFPRAMQRLIMELSKLPSIGEKSATRLAYHLVSSDRELAQSLTRVMSEALAAVRLCSKCFFLSEEELCPICRDESRDAGMLCVVEKPMDLVALERMHEFNGLYHVLHGVWAPLRGRGPESMKLDELMVRLREGKVTEVVLATSSTVEGDATALYIARLAGELGVKSSRLAQGVPKGGELEYLDDVTLSRAFAGRSVIS